LSARTDAERNVRGAAQFLFRTHDPTTVDRQGPDRGSQYRSAIFYDSPEQEKIASAVKAEVQSKYFDPKGQKVVTEIKPANQWFPAEVRPYPSSAREWPSTDGLLLRVTGLSPGVSRKQPVWLPVYVTRPSLEAIGTAADLLLEILQAPPTEFIGSCSLESLRP
jgi:hypothetical protein